MNFSLRLVVYNSRVELGEFVLSLVPASAHSCGAGLRGIKFHLLLLLLAAWFLSLSHNRRLGERLHTIPFLYFY